MTVQKVSEIESVPASKVNAALSRKRAERCLTLHYVWGAIFILAIYLIAQVVLANLGDTVHAVFKDGELKPSSLWKNVFSACAGAISVFTGALLLNYARIAAKVSQAFNLLPDERGGTSSKALVHDCTKGTDIKPGKRSRAVLERYASAYLDEQLTIGKTSSRLAMWGTRIQQTWESFTCLRLFKLTPLRQAVTLGNKASKKIGELCLEIKEAILA